MQNNIEKKIVLVTGASTGIGKACALRLDALGFQVFAGVRKPADGEALKTQASERLAYLILDVTDSQSIQAAATRVAEAAGEAGMAGLVNNAGIVVAGPLEFIPLADLRTQFEVNVFGQVAVTQAFLPLLRQNRGRIVNIGSISGRIAGPYSGAYSASKFALRSLNDSLRLELRPWQIGVFLVEPGPIATPIWDKSLHEAQQKMAHAPEALLRLYGAPLASFQEFAMHAGNTAIPPDAVVVAVVHALTAKRPKTHYLVGAETKIRSLLAFLPVRLCDWLIAKALKIDA